MYFMSILGSYAQNFAAVVLPQISVASPQRVLLLYIKKLARLKHQKSANHP